MGDHGDLEFAESLDYLRINSLTKDEEMRLFGSSVRMEEDKG